MHLGMTVVVGFLVAGAMIAANARPAQSTPPNAKRASNRRPEIQEHQGAERYPGRSIDPVHAVHHRRAGSGVRVLPRRSPAGQALEFDKDDKKEKKTAREMMQMMFAINKNNFDGEREVTCNTCHRGSPHPQAIPAIMAEAPKPEAMEAMHSTVTIPLRCRRARRCWPEIHPGARRGGRADKVSTRVEKGNALMPEGPPIAIDIYTKAPDQRVSVMHMPKGDSVTAYNGQAGWIAFPGRPMREMSAADQMAAKLDAEAFYPTSVRA